MSGFLLVYAFAGAARLAMGVAAIAVVPLAADASPQDDHAPLKSDVTSAFRVVAESKAQSPDLDAPFDVKEFLRPYKIGDQYLFQILGKNKGIKVFSLNEFELCRIDIRIKKENEWMDVGSYVDLACDGTFENTRRPVTLVTDYTFLKSNDLVSDFMKGVDISISDVGTHFWSPILAFSRPLVESTARLQKYFGEEKNRFSFSYIEGR